MHLKEYKQELMKDPEFRKEYNRFGFVITSEMKAILKMFPLLIFLLVTCFLMGGWMGLGVLVSVIILILLVCLFCQGLLEL